MAELTFVEGCSLVMKNLEIHEIDLSTSLPLQYADEGIRAGFPSPAQEYISQTVDLNKKLIHHLAWLNPFQFRLSTYQDNEG